MRKVRQHCHVSSVHQTPSGLRIYDALGKLIAVASYDAGSLSPFMSSIRPHGPPRCRAFWRGGRRAVSPENAVPRLVVGWRILWLLSYEGVARCISHASCKDMMPGRGGAPNSFGDSCGVRDASHRRASYWLSRPHFNLTSLLCDLEVRICLLFLSMDVQVPLPSICGTLSVCFWGKTISVQRGGIT